ncbi:MAG: replication factor C small subunit [Candidatus Brockarchaeota archaeon]|nr:replication factor C small subunit [Candidatus Brockarchaeota archaeon]
METAGLSRILWNEKYRPKRLKDVAGQERVVAALKAFAEKKKLPDLLLLGPPGSARGTSALCLVSELYGNDLGTHFLELDSAERDVLARIKEFAGFRPVGQRLPFKTVLVHQLDGMDPGAQQSLRRVMERSSSTCRFVYTAQYKDRVISAILSRCSTLVFLPYPSGTIRSIVAKILEAEGVEYDAPGLRRIAEHSEGNMRRAIDLAQAVSTSKGKASAIAVYQVLENLFPNDVKHVFELAFGGDFQRSRAALRELLAEPGYSGQEVIRQLQKEVSKLGLRAEDELRFMEAAAEADARIAMGGEPEVQISCLLARLAAYGAAGGRRKPSLRP